MIYLVERGIAGKERDRRGLGYTRKGKQENKEQKGTKGPVKSTIVSKLA